MTEKPEKQARYEYMDLLTSALTDHERKLNTLIERLNKAVDKLSMLTNLEPLWQAEQQIIEEDDQSEEELVALLETARNIL